MPAAPSDGLSGGPPAADPPAAAVDPDLLRALEALVSPGAARALAPAFGARPFAAGERLLVEGGPPHGLLILTSGELEVDVGEPPVRVGHVGAGAVCGEASFLGGGPTTATVRARTSGLAWELPPSALDPLAAGRSAEGAELLRALCRVMADRLAQTAEAARTPPAPAAPRSILRTLLGLLRGED